MLYVLMNMLFQKDREFIEQYSMMIVMNIFESCIYSLNK